MELKLLLKQHVLCARMKTHGTASQPCLDLEFPAGNFLLCMAILVAGGSASQVLQIFSHMGLGCVALNTFFKYQRVIIGHTFFFYMYM